MRILRVLALIMSLILSYAHAVNESGFITDIIVSGAKQAVVMAGILCIADGILEMLDGQSLLPSIEVSDSSTINGGLKTGLGTVLFVAGQPSQ